MCTFPATAKFRYSMATVSVVIPTTKRPRLLVRAIHSVLAQTMVHFELIVVVDGQNADTLRALEGISDNRLRIVQNEQPLGPGGARNAGAAVARGTWLAFLDDDDTWEKSKLERQLAMATATRADHPVIVSCLSAIVTPRARYVWPSHIYDNLMPIDDYLFDRRSMFKGDTYLQTSSFLMPREFFNSI